MKKIIIIDYNMGNVHSVQNALCFLGFESVLSSCPDQIQDADVVILPGVGAFGDGIEALKERKLIEPIRNFIATGKPFVGICLGMQLLLEKSYEMGEHEGLGIVSGEVLKFELEDKTLKIPHMGWNQVQQVQPDLLFKDINDQENFYFVHSYYVKPKNDKVVIASTDYGHSFCSILKQDNVYGIQFHPEKSQSVGLKMLDNFIQN